MISVQGKAESATEQEPTPTTTFPPGLTPHPAMHQLLSVTQTQAQTSPPGGLPGGCLFEYDESPNHLNPYSKDRRLTPEGVTSSIGQSRDELIFNWAIRRWGPVGGSSRRWACL